MINTLVIGLSIAAIQLLIASGLSLLFGMLGVVNFAHGSLYMLGAFVAVEVIARSGSFVAALIVAPIVVGLIAAMIELTLMRPTYRQPHERQLLMTFGVLLIIEEAARMVWGLGYRRVAVPPALSGAVQFAGEVISIYRLSVLAAGICLGAALVVFIEKTRVGMVLRAAMSNAQMVRAMGVRVSLYRAFVFALGGALAAMGGVVAAPLMSVQVNMGSTIILDSFIVVILGGLGNIVGAIAGSVILGVLQAFGQQYASDWVDVITYALLVALLLLRPQGLLNALTARKA
ncbi:MAG: branched-chain amino acid ABC transporter permease [Pseudomonadota bacterium]